MSRPIVPDHEVAIIGAGFSGIGAAILLDKAGLSDYLVVEEGDGVGGAWHQNTYPGIAVDIPSFSYQSHSKPNPIGRGSMPQGTSSSLHRVFVDKYGVRDRIRFGTRVAAARFAELTDTWRLETTGGETISARHVINAAGALSQPKYPEVEGLEDFTGLRCTRPGGTTM